MIVATLLVGRPAWAEEPVVVIEGRGWGHGVGMSQEGARTMGAGGATTDEILARFYPGTTKGSSLATIRVVVLESGPRSETLAFPGGGEIRATPSGSQPAGFPVVVAPGGSVEVSRDGAGHRVAARGRNEMATGPLPGSLRLISAVVPSNPATATPSATATSTTTTSTTATPTTATSTTTSGPRPTTTTPIARTTMATTTITTSTAPPPPPATPPPGPRPSGPTTPVPTSPPAPAATTPPAQPGLVAPGGLWAVPRAGETTVVSSRGRRYRGAVEVGSDAEGRLRLVNHVEVESYLRGMGEVLDPTWPPAALRAQAVAARTYALRAATAGADLCDDERCQVYLGQAAEYPAMDKAVSDSRGQVLRFGGALASTFYSANAGGISATAEEGFGSNGVTYPYLPSAPYPSADPDPWTERARLAEVGPRMGYPGRLTGARITSAGPSGRATEVTLEGDAGPMPVDGRVFASRLGLKSTLFVLRPEVGLAPPLPDPDPRVVAQALGGLPAGGPSPGAAVDVAASREPRPWLLRQAPALLMLLLADVALMASRARRRARLAAPPADGPVTEVTRRG